MKILYPLLFLISTSAIAKCDYYYFSLDFGGAIGDGDKIVDYLGEQDVPFTLFLVGKNSSTENGKKVCQKIKNSSNRKIAIGNHTISHEGFGSKHTEAHIRQEIIGNENFMNQCDSKRVIKYFRYPKGAAHPLAEKVLTEAGYLGTYKEFFKENDTVPSKAVWWTTDTRDWVKPTGASAWAQIDYFNKNGKVLPVDKDSWRDLISTLDSAKNDAFNQKILEHFKSNDKAYPEFVSIPNVAGYHGPTADEIAKKVTSDEGRAGADGKKHCFPLMHYGGQNSLAAIKKIVPTLKANKAVFRGLGDGDTINYQLDNAIKDFSNINSGKVELKCTTNATTFKYKFLAGDTLFSVARGMINTNKTTCPKTEQSPVSKLVAAIISLNNIKDPADISPGAELIIPTDCLYVK